MQSKKLAGAKPGASTQQYLDIAEIKEDVVVLKDGTMRAVLLCSSINFSLKSEEEQQAIIEAYMRFLNALEFPLQVLIQSRRLNIDPYLTKLTEAERTQTNELLRTQIRDYHSFVANLVSLNNIMSKKFFVVVPYDPLSNKRKGWFAQVRDVLTPALTVRLRDERFRSRRNDLMQRVDEIRNLIVSMGVKHADPLDTPGLIELFYGAYNPLLYDVEKMRPTNELRIEETF